MRGKEVDQMKTSDGKKGRRGFLLGAGAAGAAGAALVVARSKGGEAGAVAAEGEAGKSGKGYRLSEHVRNYYRTTKV
jgi:hypothetical protein